MIGEKLCVELSAYLSQHGYPQLSADQKHNMNGQISATMQTDNKVRKLMGKKSDIYCIHSMCTLKCNGDYCNFKIKLSLLFIEECNSSL